MLNNREGGWVTRCGRARRVGWNLNAVTICQIPDTHVVSNRGATSLDVSLSSGLITKYSHKSLSF